MPTARTLRAVVMQLVNAGRRGNAGRRAGTGAFAGTGRRVVAGRLRRYGTVLAASALLATPTLVVASATSAPAADTGSTFRNACPQATDPGHATCFAEIRTNVAARRGFVANATPAGYSPAQLQDAYKLPSGTAGAGQVVAIVDAYDNPYVETDLAVYRQQYGLPACTAEDGCFRKVNQRGDSSGYPRADAGWAGEISLDVDMVSAACPLCRILLVEADSTSMDDLGQGVNTAVTLGAKYVSNSYGSNGEFSEETEYDEAYFDHPGVAVTASTGDYGYGVSFPAVSPHVTAVGGTSLRADGSDRGWTESAWSGAGSGCSAYEPKPYFQHDTGCGKRTDADVSAVADPNTGVAVYDTFASGGWLVFGGTSASAPLIAATYALAGPPVAGTYPNGYPYEATGELYDAVSGSNGGCGGSYLCTGATGYDGPTGLGTPHGVTAFRTGPHGTVTGTVTDARTRQPIAGARVGVGEVTATTGGDGKYTLPLPVGSVDVTASAYGYANATTAGLFVTDGGTVTANFALTSVPSVKVSGKVTDGTGHGWPVYAKLTVDGVPGGPVYTDPFTGRYSLTLPRSNTYAMHVDAVYTGYRTENVTLNLGTRDLVSNVSVGADLDQCEAVPGSRYAYDGLSTDFGGWTGTTPKDGWTVTDGYAFGETWSFDNPGNRPAPPGGDSDFAVLDANHYGTAHSYDTSLVSPIVDLTGHDNPEIGFDTDYPTSTHSTVDVDVSVDGGATWQTLWHHTTDGQYGAVMLPIPQAAGKSTVRVRFHYKGFWSQWWALDNVYVGNRTCQAVPGGLVAGLVRDDNTGGPVNGATVARAGASGSGVSAATTEDPRLPDGFYWLFSPDTGKQQLTASYGRYTDQTERVKVAANGIARQDYRLRAGHLSVSTTNVTVSQPVGAHAVRTVNFRNDGTEPVHVKLAEQDGGYTVGGKPATAAYAAAAGPATQHIKGHYQPTRHTGAAGGTAAPTDAAPSDEPWQRVDEYPIPIADNGAATIAGKVYSVGGYNGSADVASGYVYDPGAGWAPIADMSTTREDPQVAAIAGKLYVSGGLGFDGDALASSEAYDPVTNRWTPIAANPDPHAGAGVAAIAGSMYVIGGCTDTCGATTALRYDANADSWTRLADYPEPVSFEACGGLEGLLYCAGGLSDNGSTSHGYVYDPNANTWSPIPDMPSDFWGSAYAGANGQLLVSGGIIDDSTTLTNEGVAYDPAAGAWHPLPNADLARYRGGSACGLYQIGGGTSEANPSLADVQLLPGMDQCGISDVSWLSTDRTEFDLKPGHSVRVAVTADASVVSGLGDYRAAVLADTDTPYSVSPLNVTMTVTARKHH